MAGKCPWKVIPPSPGTETSFSDVMSEQLASSLIQSDHAELRNNSSSRNKRFSPKSELISYSSSDDESSGEAIAGFLQSQYDKEHNVRLSAEENHFNGSSKISVSYTNYRASVVNPLSPSSDSDFVDEEEEDEDHTGPEERDDLDIYETTEREAGLPLPRRGYKKLGDALITKHDPHLNRMNNGRRIMEFPPGIQTGDGAKWGMNVNNSVYNGIRNFSVKEGKRKNRVVDKQDKSTANQALDPRTRLILYKMVDNGTLLSVNGVISTGKEALIIHAQGGNEGDDDDSRIPVPSECVLKIFKTTLNEFKNRDKYIKDDYRFKDRFSKQNPRKVIHMWAEKELHNLTKMADNGIKVPRPVILKKHVLLMSFIGSEGVPAPKLKDADLTLPDAISAYEQIVTAMKDLYHRCHLVHADLSEYNILWHRRECWFIDVSGSVEPNHPQGLELLMRDCRNVVDFFEKKFGKEMSLPGADDLFRQISGLPLENGNLEDLLATVGLYDKNRESLTDPQGNDVISGPDIFENYWEMSKKDDVDERESISSGPIDIPGHKGKSRNRKSTGSGSSFGKQSLPKSSSYGGKSLVSMTDEELNEVKDRALKRAIGNDECD